mmetsp:Transcript_34863/g.83601  ORF Transcript_34863/g.83601 Transcript_34863/m.83601 type:complete len:257 (+) Transcript_34863:610-1380(+)
MVLTMENTRVRNALTYLSSRITRMPRKARTSRIVRIIRKWPDVEPACVATRSQISTAVSSTDEKITTKSRLFQNASRPQKKPEQPNAKNFRKNSTRNTHTMSVLRMPYTLGMSSCPSLVATSTSTPSRIKFTRIKPMTQFVNMVWVTMRRQAIRQGPLPNMSASIVFILLKLLVKVLADCWTASSAFFCCSLKEVRTKDCFELPRLMLFLAGCSSSEGFELSTVNSDCDLRRASAGRGESGSGSSLAASLGACSGS